MLSVETIRNVMAQYAMGLSHGHTKQDRNQNKANDGDFYQEGYDDALSGRRTDLSDQHCLHVGKHGEHEESFARRQVLFAFRNVAGRAKDEREAVNGIYLEATKIMAERERFFKACPACSLVRGEPPTLPGQEERTVEPQRPTSVSDFFAPPGQK